MTELVIQASEILLKRLQKIAQQEQKSVEEVAAEMLERRFAQLDEKEIPIEVDSDAPAGTLAALAASAMRANFVSEKPVDTSERTNEILNKEYPEHLATEEQLADAR